MGHTNIPGQQSQSRVREHLANERTFLAWMRSAISMMGFGIVIVRLRYFQIPQLPGTGNGWKLGLFFAVVGLTTVLLSTLHYFSVRNAIDEDTYNSSGRWIFLLSIAVTLLGAGVTFLVFTPPSTPMTFYVNDPD